MKIKVGIIGPQDSVKYILQVAESYKDIDFIPFSYEATEDTLTILKENDHMIDQWLFSGQAPYHFALANGVITESRGSYPSLQGSSFFGTLLGAVLNEGKIIRNFSIDTISDSVFQTADEDHFLHTLQFYSFPYRGYMPSDELVAFHQTLYEEGKIDAALTCIRSVYLRLKNLGIPCYRVKPTQSAIKIQLDLLKERSLSGKYRMSQLAIFGAEVIQEEKYPSYKLKHQILDLSRLLLDFTEETKGSFVQMGDGLFVIYTTKGELDLSIDGKRIENLMKTIHIQTGVKIRVGLGYGMTVFEADQHLRYALQHAREHKSETFVMVNEEKEVTEFYHQESTIQFHTRKWGKEWEKKFKEASISPGMVSKIESLANHYRKTHITTNDLSIWLNSSERNGRRILGELEKLGLAIATGEEQSGHRGRPRKIYKLLFV